MDKKKLEELSADHERWDNGELGKSAEHVAFLSDEEEKAIDEGLGLQLISIRLSKSLIDQLKGLAKLEGIGYQPLIRHVLTKYAKENAYRLDLLLSVSEALKRAEKLFAQAIKYQKRISTLAPLSHERISVERDHVDALAQANTLFRKVAEQSSDPILKKHSRLRIDQIAALCSEDVRAERDKKKKAV